MTTMDRIMKFITVLILLAVSAGASWAQEDKTAQQTVIRVSFRNSEDTKSVWPFKEVKPTKENPFNEGVLTTKKGVEVAALSTKGMYLNSKLGLMFGGAAGDYIEAPAVPGKRLVKVVYKMSGSGAAGRLAICDGEGNVVPGGKALQTAEEGRTHRWVLKESVPGMVYRVQTTHESMAKVKSLVFFYE